MIRVRLPHHLQVLAGCDREVQLELEGAVTQRAILQALETRYPMLRGTVRDHVTMQRRPLVRFFADGIDVTYESPDADLPASVAAGAEPFIIIGAVAGG